MLFVFLTAGLFIYSLIANIFQFFNREWSISINYADF